MPHSTRSTRREGSAYRACLYLLMLSLYVFMDRALGCPLTELHNANLKNANLKRAEPDKADQRSDLRRLLPPFHPGGLAA